MPGELRAASELMEIEALRAQVAALEAEKKLLCELKSNS